MDNITDITNLPERKAREASEPGKFNFLDRLANRNYPEEHVTVYLDEAAGLKLKELLAQHADAEDGEAAVAIEEKMTAVYERLEASRYTVNLMGISVEEYDAVIDLGLESYPVEYEESVTPLTFQKVKTPLPSEERETLIRTVLWSKFIRSVEDVDGNMDDAITPEWVAVFLNNLPIMGQMRIKDAVETLRMTTDWMDAIQDEDFFLKS